MFATIEEHYKKVTDNSFLYMGIGDMAFLSSEILGLSLCKSAKCV